MAKTDKSTKKTASKKADPIKEKPVAVPVSSRKILAKAAALAKHLSESSSEESDSSEAAPPVKSGASSLSAKFIASNASLVKKTSDSSDDSSDSSSSEESDTRSKGKASLVKTPGTLSLH